MKVTVEGAPTGMSLSHPVPGVRGFASFASRALLLSRLFQGSVDGVNEARFWPSHSTLVFFFLGHSLHLVRDFFVSSLKTTRVERSTRSEEMVPISSALKVNHFRRAAFRMRRSRYCRRQRGECRARGGGSSLPFPFSHHSIV